MTGPQPPRAHATGLDLTVGVSVALPEPHADELTAWRTKVGDPLARLVVPHITVVPPTVIDEIRLGRITRHLAMVCLQHEPFWVHLRGTGSFRPVSRVVFVTVAHGISALEMLAADVRTGSLRQQLRFPYHPHVTVAHDVPDDMLDLAYDGLGDFTARFVVDAITLHRQETDGHWTPIREFALGGRG